MAQDFFRIEKGLSIDIADIDITYLHGAGAPGGTTDTDAVLVGSVYTDSNNGELYTKYLAGSGTDRWEKMATETFVTGQITSGISWREPVAARDDVSVAIPTGVATNPIIVDGVSITDGDRVLFSNVALQPNNNVYIYDQASGTFTESTNLATDNDTLYVNEGTDAGQSYTYNDTTNLWVKSNASDLTELGFIQAYTGKPGDGSLLPQYSSITTVATNDALNVAIGKLDAESDDVRNFIGSTGVGDDTPAYASAITVTQGGDLVQAIGELDAVVSTAAAEDAFQNTFIGKTGLGSELPNYANENVITDGDDIVTAISKLDAERGVDVTTNTIIDGTDNINTNIQSIADYVEENNLEVTSAGITSATTVDSLLARFVEWDVLVDDGAGKTFATKIMAMHDGTSVDFNNAGRLRIGGRIAGLDVNVILTGGNTLELQVTSTGAVSVTTKRVSAIV